MKYTNKDIEIFIITCNRAELLQRTIKNVLGQTLSSQITVLDNSTDEHTAEILQTNYPALRYIHTEQIPLANLRMLQKVAEKTFFILLHDDDLIHPKYLERILKILNSAQGIDLIAPSQTHFNDESKINFQAELTASYIYFPDKYLFAGYCHNMFPSWSGSLTRTENFKKIDLLGNEKLYGKIIDEIFLVKSVSNSAAVIPNPSGLYYYHHEGQDSVNTTTNITTAQFENYLKFYQAMTGVKNQTDCYAMYLLAYSRHLNHYKWFVQNTISYDSFMQDMYDKGIIDKKILFYSKRYKSGMYKLLTLPLKLFYGTKFSKLINDNKRNIK